MVFYVNHDGYNGQPDHNAVGAKEKVYSFHAKIYTEVIFTKNDLYNNYIEMHVRGHYKVFSVATGIK